MQNRLAVDEYSLLYQEMTRDLQSRYIIFGYGSLIWKPPSNAIKGTTGYIRGYVRRFCQSSNDHRGTVEEPGRVVSVVKVEEWATLANENLEDIDDRVWGTAWEIDPVYAEEVRAELEYREKDGYSVHLEDVYAIVNGIETIVVPQATLFVGLSSNPSFIGSEPLDQLSKHIHRSVGPSGPNKEYLYNLATAVKKLSPESFDKYLYGLNDAVKALDVVESSSTPAQ